MNKNEVIRKIEFLDEVERTNDFGDRLLIVLKSVSNDEYDKQKEKFEKDIYKLFGIYPTPGDVEPEDWFIFWSELDLNENIKKLQKIKENLKTSKKDLRTSKKERFVEGEPWYAKGDGWNTDSDAIQDILSFAEEVARVAYELKSCSRGSYAIDGDDAGALQYKIEELREWLEYMRIPN